MEEIAIILLVIATFIIAVSLAYAILNWIFAVPMYLQRIAIALEKIAKK